MLSGIYKITDIINNKAYIGRAVDLKNREWRHYCYCEPEKYSKASLQPEINMRIHQAMMQNRNKDNFLFEVLEYCPVEFLDEREQYYISYYNTKFPNGYNSTDGGQTYPHRKGEEHYNHSLTQYQVDQIYDFLISGKTVKEIQTIIPQASMETISAINNGYNWRKENYNYPLSRLNGVIKINDEEIKKIRTLWKNGKTITEIKKLYPFIARTTISDIISGKTHKGIAMDYEFTPQKKHQFSEEEVNLYRKMYFIEQKTTKEIYEYYCSITEEPITISSFLDMIKGRSYKQFKVYIENKKPYEETRRGQEAQKKQLKLERNILIQKLHDQGLNKQEIAKQAQCSVRTVYRILGAKQK